MFRLEYLKVKDHPQLGDLELSFTEANELKNDESPYKSVLIGPNGTGKSYILRTIIDLFREMNELKTNGKRKKYVVGYYLIKFWVDDIMYSYGNIYEQGNDSSRFIGTLVPGGQQWRERGKEYFFKINNTTAGNDKIILPGAILASSIMLTDKYIFLSKQEEFPIYKYLGIRSSKSSAGTRSYIKNTISLLAKSVEKGIFVKTLPKVLNFLELENYLFLSYSVKRRDLFFNGEVKQSTFFNFVKNYEQGFKERNDKESKTIVPWYALQHYQSLIQDEQKLYSIVNFLNEKFSKPKKSSKTGDDFFEYDILGNLSKLEEDIPYINLLEKLNLVGPPEIHFKKMGNDSYSFEGASSGEAHFLTSIIGILASITNDSIILIDEPEISLHPNWQMKYMEFLREVFEDFGSCHFIIATHSHFLISDLMGESSKILGLKRESNGIEVVELPRNLDTFGWSAEQVLLDIFNVATTRNYAIAEKLGILLDFIADETNSDDLVKEKFTQLELHKLNNLKETDPLKEVYNTILKEYDLD